MFRHVWWLWLKTVLLSMAKSSVLIEIKQCRKTSVCACVWCAFGVFCLLGLAV